MSSEHSPQREPPKDEPGHHNDHSKVDENCLQDQSSRMPLRKVLIVYFGIGLALVIAFMDQSAVSTATPVIANDLNASNTISWVGTAFFVGNCAFQLVYGRISDIFGRKNVLQAAILLLTVGNILCSVAQTPIQLYAFRAVSGIGGGGITNIAMVIVSDIVPLKERGKYQGFISAACSLGSAIGPFVGGGLASAGQWRWLFRVIAISAVVTAFAIHWIVPLKPVHGKMLPKIKMIDYLGILLSSSATIFLLVPISGGGSTFAWSSPLTIILLVLGVGCLASFVAVEAWLAKIPILPMRLFRMWTPTVVMALSFLLGMVYFGNMYYVPIYLQYVKGYSALVAGALMLAFTFPQAIWGVVAGFYVSKTNHYKHIITVGAILWTLGAGLQIYWSTDSSLGEIIGFLEISAVGVGFNLQTTLVAALATTKNEDRAVVTGGRNYARTMGAGFGLAAANAIYQQDVSRQLAAITALTSEQQSELSVSALGDLDALPADLQHLVRGAYAHGLRMVFIAFTAMSAACMLVGLLIKVSTSRS
ncbi:major facilitator superfamily domain-containing protein [Microdochium trichocladiopsis]|uniref:Major facilitator superfamily domain-containing protein n=1 Tax=Microdochium trichocladiopsis TaxID=1682393 RepID=A0A9P8XYM0_9PEZI|nr:major facilitator superfamily domain-containing protein [Microdochium trichocladiopsis]KAH7024950.1 major facilitator superfamily domain-containing protein [Microdochium trichocladiopsis]